MEDIEIVPQNVPIDRTSYIVTERLVSRPSEVHYAWTRDTLSEAMELVIEKIKTNGAARMYSCYLSII